MPGLDLNRGLARDIEPEDERTAAPPPAPEANVALTYEYPDPEECSRNFAWPPRVNELIGEWPVPAALALAPAPAAPADDEDNEGEDEEEDEDNAALPAAAAATFADQTPGGLDHRVSLRDREARTAGAADPSRTTRWVCYVRGCALSSSTTNKREIGRHWGWGAHPNEGAHEPRRVFGVDYANWLADDGLRANWEATTRGEFEWLRREQEGEEDDDDNDDDDDDDEMEE